MFWHDVKTRLERPCKIVVVNFGVFAGVFLCDHGLFWFIGLCLGAPAHAQGPDATVLHVAKLVSLIVISGFALALTIVHLWQHYQDAWREGGGQ